MYYPISENKGADQLRGYREADLRLCFLHMQNPVFSRRGLYGKWSIVSVSSPNMKETLHFMLLPNQITNG